MTTSGGANRKDVRKPIRRTIPSSRKGVLFCSHERNQHPTIRTLMNTITLESDNQKFLLTRHAWKAKQNTVKESIKDMDSKSEIQDAKQAIESAIPYLNDCYGEDAFASIVGLAEQAFNASGITSLQLGGLTPATINSDGEVTNVTSCDFKFDPHQQDEWDELMQTIKERMDSREGSDHAKEGYRRNVIDNPDMHVVSSKARLNKSGDTLTLIAKRKKQDSENALANAKRVGLLLESEKEESE